MRVLTSIVSLARDLLFRTRRRLRRVDGVHFLRLLATRTALFAAGSGYHSSLAVRPDVADEPALLGLVPTRTCQEWSHGYPICESYELLLLSSEPKLTWRNLQIHGNSKRQWVEVNEQT